MDVDVGNLLVAIMPVVVILVVIIAVTMLVIMTMLMRVGPHARSFSLKLNRNPRLTPNPLPLCPVAHQFAILVDLALGSCNASGFVGLVVLLRGVPLVDAFLEVWEL
jgi:hypothetical protein